MCIRGLTMRFPLKAVAVLVGALAATPAAASITFSNTGDSPSLIFLDGNQPGTSATLLLDLTGNSGGLFTFSYVLTNTSNTAINPTGVVSSFGFNDIGVSTTTGSINGDFSNIIFGGSGPGPFNGIQICFNNSNGNGNGCSSGGGVLVGDPGTGTFTLQYGAAVTSLTLGDFAVRYQALANGGSGTGVETTPPVPEPTTWAMMLLGFAAAGYAIRRRRKFVLTQVA